MPTFDTPRPIALTVELGVGDIRITASDRSDTIVEVRPSDRESESDTDAAARTRVEFGDDRLLVKGPNVRRSIGWGRGRHSIDVVIDVPADSQLAGSAGAAALRTHGPLGACEYKIAAGDIDVDEAASVRLRTGAGDIGADHVAGDADVATSSGAVRLGRVDGAATVKNSNGNTSIAGVDGDLRVNAANGNVAVGDAHGDAFVKTANGTIEVAAVIRGSVVAETAVGKVDIGVADGVAAWLDLNTNFGRVHSELGQSEKPAAGEESVEVRARSAFGDITIRRAHLDSARRAS
ncbi:MAG TPA: DUF4097 family beta strand repeat-containing protein [Acidimicrobiia bacterium]|jgi:hypothetical protein